MKPSVMVGIALAILSVFFYYSMFLPHLEQQKQLRNWILERPQREEARIELASEALQSWLKVLELPQFEDKKKREAAARQLSIVLFDQLMLGRKMDSRPNTGSKH